MGDPGRETRHKEELIERLETHLAALKMNAETLKAKFPADKRWMANIDALPVEHVEPVPEADKLVTLEEADDLVSWALNNWMHIRDLEVAPQPDKGYPGLIKTIQSRIVSTDELETSVVGAFSMHVVPFGRSLIIEGLDPEKHIESGKLKCMRYIVILSLPEPNAIVVDGRRISVESRMVFRYAAIGKDLVTKPLNTWEKPLVVLSFLFHIPEEIIGT